MPLSALVGERILCMHGGLSPTLKNFDQLRNLERPTEASTPGLTMDLLWADPVIGGQCGLNRASTEWLRLGQQGFLPNMRGASFGFGPDALAQMCKELDIDLASTAHGDL